MICLSFDIEERFHSHLSPPDTPVSWKMYDRIARIIDWLEETGKVATFFVVGEVAEKYPELIERFVRIGGEVASHSYSHIWIDVARQKSCLADIERSKNVLEDITGKKILGFRAPTWSASLNDHWLWENLAEMGFRYDSSLFPFNAGLYGSYRNPILPFALNENLIEIPPAVAQFSLLRIPYCGGFYFRLLPRPLISSLARRDIRKGRTPVMYFHPWEFADCQDVPEKGVFKRFIAHYGVSRAWEKFKQLILPFECTTLEEQWRRLRNIAE